MQSELETRPSYQFFSQINSAMTAGEKVTRKRFFFENPYVDARKQMALANAQLKEFKKNITQEENARKDYITPDNLTKARNDANNDLENAKIKYNEINDNNDAIKAKLIASEDVITNNLRVEESKLNSLRGDKFTEEKLAYDKSKERLTDLRVKQKNLQRIIDKKYPACFPWRVKNEMREMADIDAEINAVSLKIANYDESQKAFAEQEKVIADLRKQLDVIQENITVHKVKYPALITSANEAVTQAQIKLKQTDIEIQKNKTRYYTALSEVTMESLLKLYSAFLAYKDSIDSLKQKSKSNDIAKFAGQLSSVASSVDELMKQLWCPEQGNQCAKNLYLEQLDERSKKLAVNQ